MPPEPKTTPQQLATLIGSVNSLTELLGEHDRDCMEKADKLEHAVWGDKDSIMVRLTRIEHAQATKDAGLNRVAVYFALATGSIGTLLAVIGLIIQLRGGVGP